MQFHPAAPVSPLPFRRPSTDPVARRAGWTDSPTSVEDRVAVVTLMVQPASGPPRRDGEPLRVRLTPGHDGALRIDGGAPPTGRAAPAAAPSADPVLPVGRIVFSVDADGDRVDHVALIPIGGAPSSIMRLALRAGERDPIDRKPDGSTQGTVETPAVDLDAGPYLLLCRICGHLPSAPTTHTARAA
jgi:hypothetical protein